MARLLYQLDWPDYDDFESYDEYREVEEERWEELMEEAEEIDPDDECIVGAVLRFPRADGYAFYRVEAQDPLALAHVPYGDGYAIPSAHCRGLREDDVRNAFTFGKSLAEVTGGDGE